MNRQKEYQIRSMESFGEQFYRIVERKDLNDSWRVTLGTYDYSDIRDAQYKVEELRRRA